MTELQTARTRVCIVTSVLVGPIRDSGAGTWYSSLARTLADAGHRVTILYVLNDYCEQGSFADWVAHYAGLGIELAPLPPTGSPSLNAPRLGKLSYATFEWLRRRQDDFDVVHFHEWRGHGFYCLQAKRQGLAFAGNILVVGTHCPSLWLLSSNSEFATHREDLEADFMERESVAMADIVVSPSQYLLDWMRGRGWRLPQRAEVMPYIYLDGTPRDAAYDADTREIKEIVFFGKLEERNGLVIFCEALDDLKQPVRVTFLGKRSSIRGSDSGVFLRRWASRWKQAPTILDTLDHFQAMDYLCLPGRLAVIPSLVDSHPYTVLDCLGNGIPFIASNAGGIPEMVAPGDALRVLFTPGREGLRARIEAALRDGVRLAEPLPDMRCKWVDWHRNLVAPTPVVPALPSISAAGNPLVSVCVIHRNRPKFLEQAIRSLEEQTYPNVEVVLVDDGSTDSDALALLDRLESRFLARGWSLLRQPNRFMGAARNTAARHAHGEYLLFMDDDNIAKPHELATFVKTVAVSGADILTSFVDAFSGNGYGPASGTPDFRWLPLGATVALGFFDNHFGDANFLVRRAVFLEVGGFTEDFGIVQEDVEFFAKAVLLGYRLEVVPEALFWYRIHPGGFLRNSSDYRNRMRGIRPYLDAVPESLRNTLEYALGLYMADAKNRTKKADTTRTDYQAMVDLYWNSLSWRITAPARKFRRKLSGEKAEVSPVVHSREEAARVINEIRQTMSWELTGPLRVMNLLVRKLVRRLGGR